MSSSSSQFLNFLSWRNRYTRLVIGVVAISALVYIFLINNIQENGFELDSKAKGHGDLELSQVTKDTIYVRKVFKDWQTCIQKTADYSEFKKFWDSFSITLEKCKNNTEARLVELVPVKNLDEIKHYIFSPKEEKSVVVTLGIGADVEAEKWIKSKLPADSEFFGADPIVSPNSDLFSPIGIFFPIAVGKDTGLLQSNVRLDDGNYKMTTMANIDVITFFTKLMNRTLIDHLFLDNEGPEYDLLPMMAKNAEFDAHNIVICHMNVEIHHAPVGSDKAEKFVRMMKQIFADGRYVPIRAVNALHQRTFFINVDHPYCINKYLTQFFPVQKQL
ncbi:unnamed protein product [Caenorhabditis auriculariae]|uniref:Methyltransferase FkbM domain-containing protein n=1 Tax=Caenorhabditis auriculariae TaxID=2777116 RepID=A0A8S1H0R5_9PELO|nr:unnamed protein product [Caenorhabditis auriculariae]